MKNKVLLVDDDADLLATFSRLFRKQFRIDTALAAKEGLKAVSQRGPYAVIVSDMRMPGMDGIQFLSRVKEVVPDTVRIMLTGNADQDTAIQAVNEGSIFRFLTKPCPPEIFSAAVNAGFEQYRLVIAERELLEKTLSRSIKVLIDILSMVNPVAFSRAVHIHKYIRHIVSELSLRNSWKYEISAMLSQIGCVTIPSDIIEKYYAGQELTESERKMFNSHPSVGRELLEKIPRLENIALMIENQEKPFNNYHNGNPPSMRGEVELGAQMLRTSIEFDRLLSRGASIAEAIKKLLLKPNDCDSVIVSTLKNIEIEKLEKVVDLVKVANLTSGMVLDEDIYSKNNILIAPKGNEITYALREKLKNFSNNQLIKNEVRVISERRNINVASQ